MSGPDCRCWKCTASRFDECVAHRNNEQPMTVVERIPAGHNSLPRDVEVGETVWHFVGPTYGCIGWPEVAISLVGTHTYPFHGVPVTSVQPMSRVPS